MSNASRKRVPHYSSWHRRKGHHPTWKAKEHFAANSCSACAANFAIKSCPLRVASCRKKIKTFRRDRSTWGNSGDCDTAIFAISPISPQMIVGYGENLYEMKLGWKTARPKERYCDRFGIEQTVYMSQVRVCNRTQDAGIPSLRLLVTFAALTHLPLGGFAIENGN
jgi:hypothetical protein